MKLRAGIVYSGEPARVIVNGRFAEWWEVIDEQDEIRHRFRAVAPAHVEDLPSLAAGSYRVRPEGVEVRSSWSARTASI